MKIRARDKWRDRNQVRSIEDNAVALAYTAWQIALTAAKNLHAEDFAYDSDEQRVGIIREYLCFLIHFADRRAYAGMDQESRHCFVSAMAREVARHYQRNLEDIWGQGDYRDGFLEVLNERSAEYANTRFSDQGPEFEALRCLGVKTQEIMGMSQTNRWVMQQIMDLDAPQAAVELGKAMDNLLRSAQTEIRTRDFSVAGPD